MKNYSFTEENNTNNNNIYKNMGNFIEKDNEFNIKYKKLILERNNEYKKFKYEINPSTVHKEFIKYKEKPNNNINYEYYIEIFLRAIENNNLNTVKEYINKVYNKLIYDIENNNDFRCPINIAVSNKNIEILKYILSYNEELNRNYLNKKHESYIISIKNHNYKAQFELLYHGININKKYKNKQHSIFSSYVKNIINDGYLKHIQLMIIFGGQIQDVIDYIKITEIYNTDISKWIDTVKNWSRYRIACSILSPEQFKRLNKSGHIKPDYDNETLQNVLLSANSQKMKEVVTNYYKGWNPNIHHYYNHTFQSQIITVLTIVLRIDNLIEEKNNNYLETNSSNIMNFWLPDEVWIYLLQYI